ncbi:SET domain-containing protein SmydA-8, isoform B, partial [Clarias magur]
MCLPQFFHSNLIQRASRRSSWLEPMWRCLTCIHCLPAARHVAWTDLYIGPTLSLSFTTETQRYGKKRMCEDILE